MAKTKNNNESARVGDYAILLSPVISEKRRG
jgi:hypothetical protein